VGLGRDYSGNGNYWTTNNISITAGVTYDSMTDVPTLTSATTANYAVLNPLATLGSVSISYSNGNLNWSSSQGTGISTIGLTTGKFYAEVVATSISASNFECGLITEPYLITAGYRSNGTKDVDSGSNNSSYGASYVANDVIGIAVDVDAKSITFYKNNTSQGSFTFTNNGPYFFASIDRGPNASTGFWNFGQRPFVYTPPTGFNRLNTFNLPTPTIGASASTLANNNFNAVLYAGNSATQAIGGLNFQPDLVWTKSRSSNSTNHLLTDVSRGVTNSLMSNNDTVQGTRGVSSFNSNGFTYIAPNEGGDGNVSGQNYVGWCWKANGAPVTNTAGSITSQVSANTSAGFSIVRHVNTGSAATIGHGLGVAPRFIINRVYDRAENWRTYFGVANQYLILNGTNSAITDTSIWNNTQPTSSVFSIGAYFSSGDDIISYCFTPIANYSAIGTYTGNGSTDGPFVFTGFRPRFVMIKNITTGSTNWFIYDAARNTFNLTNAVLLPSNSTAELTSDGGGAFGFDFVSNGFKIRTSRGDNNNNADTFIYAAFAESPFKYANAR
jgi:hypothetical protein